MIKPEEIDKHLEEYKPLKKLYLDFSHKIKSILEVLLHKIDFKYQVVTHREKNEESLRDKLQKKKIKSVKEINDLAGCRVIFYLDNDVQKFTNYLWKEFKVIDKDLKYSDDSYNAFHFIIRLGKNRLELTEYERFNGLKCEIQLTTVLCHAWSELAHDTIYKKESSIFGFDKNTFDLINRQFSDTMRNHIKQAQYNFEFIFKVIEKLKQGKWVFDDLFLKLIGNLKTNNNEIYEILQVILKHIKEFGDKTPKELQIVEAIGSVLEKSKSLKREPIKTTFGDLPGRSYEDVAGFI